MTQGKELRDADMLRFSGGGEGALAPDARFGTNSLMTGVVSPATRLDLLDNALEMSQLGCSLAGYNRTITVPFESSSRIQLNSAALLFSINFSPAPSADPGFGIKQQVVDAPALSLVPALLNLQRRRARVKHNRRINRRSQIKHGLTLRELLRYASAGCSVPGSIN
jgi:hypothetical protein